MANSRDSDKKNDKTDLSADTPEAEGMDDALRSDEDSASENDALHSAEKNEGSETSDEPGDTPAAEEDELSAENAAAADGAEEADGAEPPETETDSEETSEGDATEDASLDAEDPDAEASGEDAGENEATPEEEPSGDPEPARQPAQPQQQSSSAWPAIFGGVVAAMIGFIAARGDLLDSVLPASMQREVVDVAEIQSLTDGISAENAALASRLDAVEADTGPDEDLLARIESLESAGPSTAAPDASVLEALESLGSAVEALAGRLTALEARPVAENTDANEALSADLAALQTAIEAQRTEIQQLQAIAADAEAAARDEAAKILARAALTRVVTAVETGETFQPALNDLEEVTPVEVPEVLKTAAAEGVPTIAGLRESFPDAARAGLAAARSEVPESDVQGISGFLRRQLSARSVTPREGEDPDAVLSRAEAALKQNNLAEALSEMEALPQAAKDAMSEWLTSAQARQAARDAANSLSDSLQQSN